MNEWVFIDNISILITKCLKYFGTNSCSLFCLLVVLIMPGVLPSALLPLTLHWRTFSRPFSLYYFFLFSLEVIKISPMGYHLGDIQDNEMANFYEFLIILSTNWYFTQHFAYFIVIFKVHLGGFVLFSTSQIQKLILKGIRIIQTPPNSRVEELRLALGPLNIGIILKFCFQKYHKNTQPYFIGVAHRLNVKGALYIGPIRSMAFFLLCV